MSDSPTSKQALVQRLREHADLHDDLANHSIEQLTWGQDLRTAANMLAHEPSVCIHPFAKLGIDGDGVMWCVECHTKPLVIPVPFGDVQTPAGDTGRYQVRVAPHSAMPDFYVWDGHIGAAEVMHAEALQALLNRAALPPTGDLIEFLHEIAAHPNAQFNVATCNPGDLTIRQAIEKRLSPTKPARKFTGVGELERTGYIPPGSAAEREAPDEKPAPNCRTPSEIGADMSPERRAMADEGATRVRADFGIADETKALLVDVCMCDTPAPDMDERHCSNCGGSLSEGASYV